MHDTYQLSCQCRPAKLVLYLQLMVATLLIVLSGCQSTRDSRFTDNIENSDINYGQYYLLLSQLSEKQLMDEIHHLKTLPLDKTKKLANNLTIEWQLKSVLVYSLPKSPIHNPFTAKSKLNQLSLAALDAVILIPADFAFFGMLKEQLNQQILLINRLTLAKKSHDKIKQTYLQQQIEFQHLQQQMMQLKKLEANINEHGR
ncbi:MAG: hypothetical protein HRT53_03865 [Colwellia sp.]|nr:hypothetical protein [Colwellia sp.]